VLVATVEHALVQRRLYQQLRRLRASEIELKRRNQQLVAQNADLFEQARMDALTGLPNRRRLDEDFTVLDANVRRYTERFAIALVDVDQFGQFNKRYGIPTGDRVLRLVATALRDACRQGDLVYRPEGRTSDPAYRLGGDEFVLVLASQDMTHAVVAMQRIREHLAEVQGREADALPREPVTISVGIAAHDPKLLLTTQEMLLEANEQLKRAKEAGGDCTRPGLPKGTTLDPRRPAPLG
jgi:diguanylate cyclase (GGDEF)-like protein